MNIPKTFLSAISTTLGAILNLLFVSLLTKNFGLEIYAQYAQWITIFSLTLVFTSFGAPAVIQATVEGRRVSYANDQKIIRNIVILSAIIIVLTTLLNYFFFIPEASINNAILLFLMIFSFNTSRTYNNIFHYTQRSLNRFRYATFSILIESGLKVAGIMILITFAIKSLTTVLLICIAASFILMLINYAYLKEFLKINFDFDAMEAVRNGSKYFLLSLIEVFISYWIAILGLVFLSILDFGILHLAISLSAIGLMIPTTIYNQEAPKIRSIRSIRNERHNDALDMVVRSLYNKVLPLYMLVSGLILLILSLYSKKLFEIEYQQINTLIYVILTANLFVVCYSPMHLVYKVYGLPDRVLKIKLFGILFGVVAITVWHISTGIDPLSIAFIYCMSQFVILAITSFNFHRGQYETRCNHHY